METYPLCRGGKSCARASIRAASLLTSRLSHSQIISTRHPMFSSAATARASRSTFAASLGSQYSLRLFGLEARRQPGCWCQKHPWTKIANRWRGNTTSGRPGRSRRCNRKRYPRACNSRRTISSGCVSDERMRDMSALRFGSISTQSTEPSSHRHAERRSFGR
jgi:hypothetical protein